MSMEDDEFETELSLGETFADENEDISETATANTNMNATANANISSNISKLAYNEAINSFYKFKNAYEDAANKMKNKIINNPELSWREKRAEFQQLKPKCINCKRPVGSIFKIHQSSETLIRDLHAMCGDRQAPCPFSIQISIPYTTTFSTMLEIDHTDIEEFKNSIIKYKNDLIFGYLSPDIGISRFERIREEMVSASKRYESSLEDYINKVDNRAKKEQLKQLTADLYININDLKTLIAEFDRSGNAQYVQEAVTMYVNDMVPKLDKIMQDKYAYSAVEYDENENVFRLIQKKLTIEQQQDNFYSGGDEIVKHFTIGMGTHVKRRTTRKNRSTMSGNLEKEQNKQKKRISRKNRSAVETILEEEEERESAERGEEESREESRESREESRESREESRESREEESV